MTKIVIFRLSYLCNRKHRGNQQQDIFQITRGDVDLKETRAAPRVEQVVVNLNALHSSFLVGLISIGFRASLAGTYTDEHIIVLAGRARPRRV